MKSPATLIDFAASQERRRPSPTVAGPVLMFWRIWARRRFEKAHDKEAAIARSAIAFTVFRSRCARAPFEDPWKLSAVLKLGWQKIQHASCGMVEGVVVEEKILSYGGKGRSSAALPRHVFRRTRSPGMVPKSFAAMPNVQSAGIPSCVERHWVQQETARCSVRFPGSVLKVPWANGQRGPVLPCAVRP